MTASPIQLTPLMRMLEGGGKAEGGGRRAEEFEFEFEDEDDDDEIEEG
jgi:hypothetical protein